MISNKDDNYSGHGAYHGILHCTSQVILIDKF